MRVQYLIITSVIVCFFTGIVSGRAVKYKNIISKSHETRQAHDTTTVHDTTQVSQTTTESANSPVSILVEETAKIKVPKEIIDIFKELQD